MRRDSATVIALVGAAPARLLAGLAGSPNVSVVRVPAARTGADGSAAAASAAGQAPAAPHDTDSPGWERGAQAMHEAARRRSTYVVVPDDPLAGVAAAWSAMWNLAGGPEGAARFEQAAADALSAWRNRRFELPDYYLVLAPPADSTVGPDLYLGPLRAARPHRVAVTAAAGASKADDAAVTAGLLDTMRSLHHGPWWPSLDTLLDGARRFYAGGLAETQPTPV